MTVVVASTSVVVTHLIAAREQGYEREGNQADEVRARNHAGAVGARHRLGSRATGAVAREAPARIYDSAVHRSKARRKRRRQASQKNRQRFYLRTGSLTPLGSSQIDNRVVGVIWGLGPAAHRTPRCTPKVEPCGFALS